ncbi:HAMP domain-containing histidine kinase [Bacillus paramycoides]|uniref:sensor histidine kinase n=1 Tax=Bacillus paramycoides TaxID=2026194 RepID=UPI002242EB74|nr:HAMP domain-containing sensor histidine kinase [Bacillus paramycoides]MCW9134076.1 HAMP domain-containing histidine kinase [Bacillus paramycoides]
MEIISLLLIGVIIYLIFLLREIKYIHEQIEYIVSTNTNAEVTSTSKQKQIIKLVNIINQLVRRKKEMQREQQKNELELHKILTNLTHDLKTPLTVANGYTEILLQNKPNDSLAPKIHDSLNTVNYYLNCLIDYNLIQEKSLKVNFEKINFSQFLMEQLFQYYEEFEQKNIHVDVDIPTNIYVLSDKIILKRVIENIISNLLKYSYQKAFISVQVMDSKIKLICKNDFLGEIEELSRIQRRFQTLDDARQNKSLGIGLHIIQELTELINGTFSINVIDDTFQVKVILKNE